MGSEKQCPKCQQTKLTDDFKRENHQGLIRIHKYCNKCWTSELVAREIRYKKLDLATMRHPKVKPVWMVIYSSFP